ncbi:hypothetical protein IGI39_001227 [Enterococcus sp. AZ135]|uniref:GNAT family N-acetyltransferase n=1 Tax=unclassified Enterococcus TaxID=2608891 RepID=UPI003F1ECF95
MKKNFSFHVYAIVTIICWSLAFVLSRLVMRELTSESLGFLRYLVASIVLLGLTPFLKLRKVESKDLGLIILTGSTGFFLYMIAFNKGVKEVNAATSSVIIATVPMITALFSRVIYKEKITIKQWFATGVSFIGVLIITILSKGFTISNGLNWLFIASLLLASYNLLQKKLVQRYSAIQSTMMSIFAGTVMLAIFLPRTINEVRGISFSSVILVLIMGIFSSAIAYVSWTKAFEVAENIASVSNYMYVTPLLTTVLGLVIAKEFPDGSTLIGGLIILAGLLLFNSDQLFAKKATIKCLDQDALETAAQVIRESFMTVANEFDLTIDNCPTNGAFTQAKHLKIDLEKGNQLFGVYQGKKMIGFFELVFNENYQVTLEKVAIIPAERGKNYGEFILNSAKEIAYENNIKHIDIGNIKNNFRLKQWYQKNGYQVVCTKNYSHLPFEVLHLKLKLKDEVGNGKVRGD